MSAGTGRPPTRNEPLLERLEPYLVAAPWHHARFDRRPLGLEIPDANVLDPTRRDAALFLDRLETLDGLTFGPEGMPMPRWVFYQAAELPGGIFGFAARADTLAPAVAGRLRLPRGASGLVPLSMYIAIPTRQRDTWFGHNLASLNRVLPELELRGLASLTKAFALKTFRCRRQAGAVQWGSPALHVHARFGPLEMLTAWTPAHEVPATITYVLDVTDEALRSALGDPAASVRRPPVALEIGSRDEAAMQDLQRRLEAGERFAVAGRPRRGGGGGFTVPVARLPRPPSG